MICSSRRLASRERWSSSTLGTLWLHRFVLGTAPSSGTLQAAAAGSRAAYRSPIPAGCVSYFAHSREFFELNDGVRAALGVNSRDAPRPRRSSSPRSNCCSDVGRLRFCGNFKSISRDAGTSFVGLTLCLHKTSAMRSAARQMCALCRRQPPFAEPGMRSCAGWGQKCPVGLCHAVWPLG